MLRNDQLRGRLRQDAVGLTIAHIRWLTSWNLPLGIWRTARPLIGTSEKSQWFPNRANVHIVCDSIVEYTRPLIKSISWTRSACLRLESEDAMKVWLHFVIVPRTRELRCRIYTQSFAHISWASYCPLRPLLNWLLSLVDDINTSSSCNSNFSGSPPLWPSPLPPPWWMSIFTRNRHLLIRSLSALRLAGMIYQLVPVVGYVKPYTTSTPIPSQGVTQGFWADRFGSTPIT